MADNTKIEWTDASWNPLAGCDPVSPGCTHCYAASMARRLGAMAEADLAAGRDPGGKGKYIGVAERRGSVDVFNGTINLAEKELDDPLRWKKPRNVFVNSMSDLFHKNVPFEYIDRVLAVMALCGAHTFQVLTKRAERLAEYLDDAHRLRNVAGEVIRRYLRLSPCVGHAAADLEDGHPLENVLFGVSVEDEKRAAERRAPLARVHELGWRTFVSYEPALGPVDWTGWEFLDWLISGGESGAGARPSHPDWHRAARDFCARHSIAYLFKQWGEWAPPEVVRLKHPDYDPNNEVSMGRVGKKAAGRLLDGVEHLEFPAVSDQ